MGKRNQKDFQDNVLCFFHFLIYILQLVVLQVLVYSQYFQDLNKKIANQEKTNIELLKHGMGTTNKLIKIIVDGVMKSSQYNNYGKNVKDESIGISSIVEEV